MPLPINIEELLNKRKVESSRIEFKKGWNPDKIYHTICAFANDLDNLGGGYILVGVEEAEGVARRPVRGLPTDEIDKIQRQMLALDAKIEPRYMTRVSVEEVDDGQILVIWVPSGLNRPYSVREHVLSHDSAPKYYVRSKSSTIEAKGEILDELRELAHRVPFDERPNSELKLSDLSPILVYDYLKKTGSRLFETFQTQNLQEILEAMALYTGPTEDRQLKNVAAMMFCEHPEQFFPVTQVDIVIFPHGLEQDPDLLIEVPKITGPVPQMIASTLEYLRTNVIKEKIIKISGQAESRRIYNYPFASLEEAVVNALYHRDYQVREPVEITVEPDKIEILSHSGPDRTISQTAILQARSLRARRYRNRRLGDFLKELGLTEGRATGIPTIQKKLRENGSAPASIQTDPDRTYFMITLPCHPGFKNKLPELTEEETQLLQIICKSKVKVNDAEYQVDTIFDIELLLQLALTLDREYWRTRSRDTRLLPLIKGVMKALLTLRVRPYSITELGKEILWDKQYELRRKIITPLLKYGYIAQTDPAHPKSPRQKYILSATGQKLLIPKPKNEL